MTLARRLARLSWLLLIAAVCGTGCTSMKLGNDMSNARHQDVIETIEAGEARGETYPWHQIGWLCDAYSETGNIAKANACADRYEKLIEAEPVGFRNEGMLKLARNQLQRWRVQGMLETGRYEELLPLVEKTLQSIDQDDNFSLHSQYAILQIKLIGMRGLTYANRKDFEKTRQAVAQLENLSCGILGPQCRDVRFQWITKLHVSLGQYKEASETVDASGMKWLMYVTTLRNFGAFSFDGYHIPRQFLQAKIDFETGKRAEAKVIYQNLYEKPATRSMGTLWWSLLYDLGRIARSEGDGALAVERLAEAVATIESQRANINTEAAKIGFVGDKQAVYNELVSLLVEQHRAPEALEYVERAKSRALVDLLAERQNFTSPEHPDSADSLKLLASLEQKYVTVASRPDEQQRLRSAMTNLVGELRQKTPELASLVTVSPTKVADIQAGLAPDQSLLEYYGQGDKLFAFLVTREAIKAVTLDGNGLEAEVRRLRDALRRVDGDAYKVPAQALFNRLIAPVPGALAKPKLIVVGHGALHYLPWAALYDGQRFLVDRVALQMLPSASVMPILAARNPAPARDVLLLGNPDLGDATMDLPGAEAEAKAIKGIWPNSTMLMRKAATKGALTKAGQLFRVIHVAAHGEFLAEQPLNSRLLLAPEGADNGQLTAGDLYGLRLNADLVTLSACETGMGKVLSGDDVVGLTRGFLYAGANSIVASLWPVSDDETKFLMTRFYGNLKTQSKTEALRQAQLETKQKYPHPFFWSAFQLTGMGR